MDDRTSQPPLISVVLSFRNEEAVIPELIQRLQSALRGAGVRYELLFVNDASTDRSLELLVRHRQDDPAVKVITMSRRFGVGPCVLAGFRHARGDAVVYMDADLQDPPELVPTLIERWREGAEAVHTTRTVRRGEHPFKMWLTSMAYRVVKALAEYPILKDSGDFKLMSRRVVDAILSLDERDPFIRGLVGWVGFKQAQVFYERDARSAGTTKFPLWCSLNPYREFLRGITGFSVLPLYLPLFAAAGFLFLAAGIGLARVCLGPVGQPAGAGIYCFVAFAAGVLSLLLGILGIYLAAVLRQVRRRPLYIVGSRIGFDDAPGAGAV